MFGPQGGRLRSLLWMTALSGLLGAFSMAAAEANYDTAWTFVYDGGKANNGYAIEDQFLDVKVLPNGEALCVGVTRDTGFLQNILLTKLSASGSPLKSKLFRASRGSAGASLLLSRTGDYWIGGWRFIAPYLIRLDTSWNVKSTTWYYDSLGDQRLLSNGAAINALYETANGKIMAVAGDHFPTNNGQNLNNYAAYLEFDSNGEKVRVNEWLNTTGYRISGWGLAADRISGLMVGGDEAVFYVDTTGVLKGKNQYTFSLPGVGTVNNRVMRIRRLRNGTVLALGQAYEEDCWTRWNRLSYDGWWTTLSIGGSANFRNTAGVSGQNDILFDATQLIDGRIVLVGFKRSLDQIGGIWALVTDSTGKDILWETQVPIKYRGDKGRSMDAYAVAATPDSGFTVVGRDLLPDSLGGANAFAAHFVPKPGPTGIRTAAGGKVHPSRANGTLAFVFDPRRGPEVELLLYTLQGRFVGRFLPNLEDAARGEIRVERGRLRRGAYLWHFRADREWSPGLAAVAD